MKTQISYNLRKCFIYHEALMVFREGENTGLVCLGFYVFVCPGFSPSHHLEGGWSDPWTALFLEPDRQHHHWRRAQVRQKEEFSKIHGKHYRTLIPNTSLYCSYLQYSTVHSL